MKISPAAKKLFEDALSHVESKSIREWAQSEHNKPIWLEICQTAIDNGEKGQDPVWMGIYITSKAIGLID